MAKNYIIMKNNEKIRTVRSFNSAKEIAEAEEAEVFCDGVKVYPDEHSSNERSSNAYQIRPYRLKALMNVREQPSTKARLIAKAEKNTVVNVIEIKNDWMKVQWDNGFAYILYGKGAFAENEYDKFQRLRV